MDSSELMTIDDAIKEHGRSRSWWNTQIADGALAVVKIPGDKRVYLMREEVAEYIKPRIERRGADGADQAV